MYFRELRQTYGREYVGLYIFIIKLFYLFTGASNKLTLILPKLIKL